MSNRGKRTYQSLVRQRQAGDTRRRIIEAAHQLLERAGYAGMTIEAIGRQAGVSVPTVYAIFKSKTGILRELLDQSTFGADYEKTVQQALNAREPAARLRFVARLARQIHEVQSATFDLLRGAGVVAPALAKLEQHRERVRYERQEPMINSLRDAGRLRPGLDHGTERDILWLFTGRDVYRMLVRERGWSPKKYESWLAATLVRSLITPARPNPVGSNRSKLAKQNYIWAPKESSRA